jgi:hypothetical protein
VRERRIGMENRADRQRPLSPCASINVIIDGGKGGRIVDLRQLRTPGCARRGRSLAVLVPNPGAEEPTALSPRQAIGLPGARTADGRPHQRRADPRPTGRKSCALSPRFWGGIGEDERLSSPTTPQCGARVGPASRHQRARVDPRLRGCARCRALAPKRSTLWLG